MNYKYDPGQFWGSMDKIKEIKGRLDEYPLSERDEIKRLLYRAMNATREACIATIDEEALEHSSYQRDKETDREFLIEVIDTFV
ncbi:MAG: hypothetical protein V1660_03175 [archaeon]